MSKVTVVGAGNVGATCANVLAVNEVANEVCLIDIKEGFAEGKAMDIMQTAQLMGFDTVVTGVTNDYSKTSGSDVVIITSGLPRKPGMTREELIGVNAGIVKSVCDQVLKYSPNAILVVVSNPMDTMAYLTLHALKLPRNRVIGMGGALDSARLKYFPSEILPEPGAEVQRQRRGRFRHRRSRRHDDDPSDELHDLQRYQRQRVPVERGAGERG